MSSPEDAAQVGREPTGVPERLATVQSEILRRLGEAGNPRAEEWTVQDESAGERTVRGWRVDVRISLSGQSFVLTTDGEWCTVVRTPDGKFGWQVVAPERLAATLGPWGDELTRTLGEMDTADGR